MAACTARLAALMIATGCELRLPPGDRASSASPSPQTSPASPSRVNYFSWDCEAEHPSLNGFEPNTSISTAESHSGSRSMRMNVRGDDSGNQTAGAVITEEIRLGPMTRGQWYYYRWWMKLDGAFSWGSGTGYVKAFRVKRTDEARPGVWTGYIGKQGFFMHEMHGAGESGTEDGPNWWDPNGPHLPYDLQSAAGSGWHEYIVAIKTQSGVMERDGIFRAYVDGALLGERTGQHFLGHDADCTEAWNGAMLRVYFQLNGTPSDGGLMWVDDYSMDNEWNSLQYPEPQ